VRDVQLML